MLEGETTSGKSWLLRPLDNVYNTFQTPQQSSTNQLANLSEAEVRRAGVPEKLEVSGTFKNYRGESGPSAESRRLSSRRLPRLDCHISCNAQVICLHEWTSGEGGATDRRGVSWSDQKLLFGGEPIQAGQSKSFAKTNETIQPKAPIFVTCQGELFHPDPKERRAMNRRFRRFTFFASIPEGEVKEIPACPKCFAHFVLQVEVPQCIEEHR